MTESSKPPSVALIGCGPGGMFLLHALEHRRTRLEREGDDEGLASLPVVTCFERSSGPGGVWRSDRFGAGSGDGATSMYEALWTNGPKECMEFFDHTYQEHFGRDLPGYLPRELVLDYLMTRCTKDKPDFFDGVKFNTTVESVTRDSERDGFVVRTVNEAGIATEECYDVCVWAAGVNGRPKTPPSILDSLRPFVGEMFHSSRTGNDFDDRVRNKRVMIVGGAYSAEDLALQAIKLGASAVEIVARSGDGAASNTAAWPMDKVKVHPECIPTAVTKDGRGIILSEVELDYDSGKYHVVPGGDTALEGIDTIIFCTGYEVNTYMLDESLSPFDNSFVRGSDLDTEHWKMPRDLTDDVLGDIPLGDIRPQESEPCIYPKLYRGRLISCPSMYFVYEPTDDPLIGLDVLAWLTLAQITGDVPTPPIEEMRRFNSQTVLECMKCHHYRYAVDVNYKREVDAVDDDVWDNLDPGAMAGELEHLQLQYRYLARDALDSGYPFKFGTYEKLNERSNRLAEMDVASSLHRSKLEKGSDDAWWRTFRDGDCSMWRSVHTGAGSVPLKRRWLELDGCTVDHIAGSVEAEGDSLSSGDESSEGEVIDDASSDGEESREASIASLTEAYHGKPKLNIEGNLFPRPDGDIDVNDERDVAEDLASEEGACSRCAVSVD